MLGLGVFTGRLSFALLAFCFWKSTDRHIFPPVTERRFSESLDYALQSGRGIFYRGHQDGELGYDYVALVWHLLRTCLP